MNGPEPPRRVLMVCDSVLKYTCTLARAVADTGAEVKLLSRDHGREFGGDVGAMREYVERTLEGRVDRLVLPGRVRQPQHWRQVLALRRLLREFDPDVVHVQETVVNDPRLLFVASMPRNRLALTVHDPVSRHDESRWQHAIKSFLLRRVSLIFTHGEALRRQLVDERGVRAPIVVVPIGLSQPDVRPLPSRPTLLAFGRIQPYKGLDVLFDAMPTVWEGVPDALLRIAGQGELPDHPVLADGRVEAINEYIPEGTIPELFVGATCVVLPYREASQSGPGSLAKKYGRATVASEVGGLPELVGDGGLLVPPASPPALAEALLEVLRTPGLAESLGRRAAAAVEESATWPAVARKTLSAYDSYLDPARSAARRAVS